MSVQSSSYFKLSLLQHFPTPLNTEAAIQRLDTAARQTAENGSFLLITPECGVTGYDMDENDAIGASFTATGAVASRIASIAAKYKVAILYGFMEKDAGYRYNSVQLVNSDGNTILHYRKTHLWGDLDRHLFTAGDKLSPVVEFHGWKLGVLICYDVEFPETVRALTLNGAELILVPTALMHPWRFVAEKMVAVRAAENQVFLAYANLVGQERNTIYEGRSCIVSPDGTLLTRAAPDKDMLLHCSLDMAELKKIRKDLPYLRDRRPELYSSLSRKS